MLSALLSIADGLPQKQTLSTGSGFQCLAGFIVYRFEMPVPVTLSGRLDEGITRICHVGMPFSCGHDA